MNVPLVSVVAICWNRKSDILESIENVLKSDYANVEVIVVDNNSTDGTAQAIEAGFEGVRLIKMYKNIGIEAYNIGFKNAKGKYLVIIDDDSYPEKSAISKMVARFEADERLGVVAFDVRNYFEYDKLTHVEGVNQDTISDSSKYLMSFNGAGAGVRRELFEEVGFYPEEFFLYWNEADAAFRILDSGYKILFFSDIVAYHKYSPQNRTSLRAPFYYSRNMFWLLWKHYPAFYAVKKTIALIHLCFYSCLEQKTFVYAKGFLNAVIHIKQPLSKRKAVKDEVWRNLRIPFESSFTFYR